MKPLLEIDSPKYLKRLVRALNEAGNHNGYYASVATFNVRCNRARFKGGRIECRGLTDDAAPQWFEPASHTFTNPYSQIITASRKP